MNMPNHPMKIHMVLIASSATALLAPRLLVAAAPSTFREFAGVFVSALNGLANIIFASLIVGMIYGVIVYLMNSDNEQKREQIKGYLLWGVIGMAVAFALWGILALLANTLGWGDIGIPLLRAPTQ